MAAKANWVAHWYKANVDTGMATPYSTVPVSTVAGYSGVTNMDSYITQSGIGYDGEAAITKDVSGSTFGSFSSTLIFRVKMWPYSFNASSQPDLDDLETLRDFFQNARYLWVRFDVGSRQQPSATDLFPVVITSFNDAVNESSGTHSLEMQLQHKYKKTK